jgi:opacity protein-like surface antigen
MKQAVVIVAILVVLCSLSAFGQAVGSWRIGVGAEGGLPIGDFNNVSSFGIGGVASAGYVVDPAFTVSLNSGYIHFSGKDFTVAGTTVNTSYNVVPILVCGKYYFMPGDTRVYGAASVGMYLLSASASATVSGVNVSASTSDTKFGFAPALGAEFKAGDKMFVDVHGNYSYISTDVTSTSFIGFGVGLVFDLQ